jgi:hypothetical protein
MISPFVNGLYAQTENGTVLSDTSGISDDDKLVVLWTSGDPDVALKMVFMYTYNAKKYGWWKDITFIVWGPSAKLLSEDTEVQEYMDKIIKEDIDVIACKYCADQYGVSDKLSKLGLTVRYVGKDFTDYIKEDRHLVTF